MKRILSVILIAALTVSLLASCSSGHFSFDHNSGEQPSGATASQADSGGSSEAPASLTRGDWAEMLGLSFGMDCCLHSEPYFPDVPASDRRFAYIQSCAEWNVLDITSGSFLPDAPATVGFAVETAVKAAELDISGYAGAAAFVTANGLAIGDTESVVTVGYAQEIVDWALEQYQNKPFVEYQNIAMQESVLSFPEVGCAEDGTLTNLPEQLPEVGSVIITAPTRENPLGIARKVSEIRYDDAGSPVIETVEPELGEVYQELDFACVATVSDAESVQTPQGVALEGLVPSAYSDHEPQLALLGSGYQETAAGKGTDLSFSVKLSKGKLTFSPAYESLKADIGLGDHPDSEMEKLAEEIFEKTGYNVKAIGEDTLTTVGGTQKLMAKDKYTAGWELTGKVALKNFYIEAELETKKVLGVPYGIKKFEYEINYEIETSLTFAGKLEEEITLAVVPIPIGGGITVDVEIFAKGSASGELEIGTRLSNLTHVKFTDENGYKKTQASDSSDSLSLSVKIEMGFGGKATLKALGIKIVDVSLEVGLGLDSSATVTALLHDEAGYYAYDNLLAQSENMHLSMLLCINAEIYAPTVTLAIGCSKGTLAEKVSLKLKWKIMGKSGATWKSPSVGLHYEAGKGIVESCTLDHLDTFSDEEMEELRKQAQGAPILGSGMLSISDYAVSGDPGDRITVSVTELPEGYKGTDIVWASDNDSVAALKSVRNSETGSICELEAIGSGITAVSARTSDGVHSLRCAVSIHYQDAVEFTPLP